MIMRIATIIAVLVGLTLFWQLSQNGRYTVVNHPEGVVLVVDMRTGAVRVRLLEMDGLRYHWVKIAPAPEEMKSEAQP
jgi:hypothetical protein